MRLVWVVIPLVLIGIVGVQESFAEQIPSPRQQLADGVTPEEIQCRENRVLVLRDNGKAACVTEITAEKLEKHGWVNHQIKNMQVQYPPNVESSKITQIPELKEIIPNEEKIFELEKERDTISQKIEDIKPIITNLESEMNIARDGSNRTSNEKLRNMFYDFRDQLEKMLVEDRAFKSQMRDLRLEIYNLKNNVEVTTEIIDNFSTWVPIRANEKQGIAQIFADIMDDPLTGEIRYRSSFVTEKGYVDFSDEVSIGLFQNVVYRSTFVISDKEQQQEIIDNFMDKMGIKLDGTEEITDWDKNPRYRTVQYFGEYGYVKFTFYQNYLSGTYIGFNGWTNHPEQVKFYLDESLALIKARDFAEKNHELNTKIDKFRCEFEFTDNHSINKAVYDGMPYYVMDIGNCTFDYFDTGHYSFPYILVDGLTGDEIFIVYHNGLD